MATQQDEPKLSAEEILLAILDELKELNAGVGMILEGNASTSLAAQIGEVKHVSELILQLLEKK